MNESDKKLVIFIINNFLIEQKPVADCNNLKYFETSHILECFDTAIDSKKLTENTVKRVKNIKYSLVLHHLEHDKSYFV